MDRVKSKVLSVIGYKETVCVESFPTIAQQEGDYLSVEVRSRIWLLTASEAHKVMYALIRKILIMKSGEEVDSDIVYGRIHTFFGNSLSKGQKMYVTFDPSIIKAPNNKMELNGETDYVGHLTTEVKIPLSNVNLAKGKPWINYTCTPLIDSSLIAATFSSNAVVIGSKGGVSVVSDIDDTIKDSFVADKTQLLLNTFCRPFKAVRGMSSLYNYWCQKYLAQFHYVSGSPWQLATVLNQDFLVKSRFPPGSIHLRNMHFPDLNILSGKEIFEKFFDQVSGAISGKGNETTLRATKFNALHYLHKRFPTRKFILVGDTGEWDAEIYGEIARTYPGRTLGIFIRRAPIVQISEDLVIKQISMQKEVLSGVRLLVSRTYHFLQVKIGKVVVRGENSGAGIGKWRVTGLRNGFPEESEKSTRETEKPGNGTEEFWEKMTWTMGEHEGNWTEWVEREVVRIRIKDDKDIVIGELDVEMTELRGANEGEGRWLKREWMNHGKEGEINLKIGFYNGKQLEEERWKDAFRELDVEGNKVTWKIFNDPEELADCEFDVTNV